VREAESLGFDSGWTAEADGSDGVTPLAWVGGQTSRIKLGTGILQMPARTPAMTAMTAATLDLLSGGRVLLGLGVSGPQVVEGWQAAPWQRRCAPRIRRIVRTIWRREQPLTPGEEYQIYPGRHRRASRCAHHSPAASASPLPRRARPQESSGEIADGWLPIFKCPRVSRPRPVDAGPARRQSIEPMTSRRPCGGAARRAGVPRAGEVNAGAL
jgi:alkanesulfonate monooxygenase SsuD/methylene tetrahydromethanopterin reductase-like flavin-dependent oxidoreductase (luciferase family)